MPTSLPIEVIELTVDFVAGRERIGDLLAFCLCSKALVARCQMYIFQAVTFCSSPSGRGVLPPADHLGMYQRTLILARLLVRKPHLADLVRSLTYKIITPFWNSPSNDTVQVALGSLSNVQAFHLSYEDAHLSQVHQHKQFDFASTPLTWRGAVRSIMKSPKFTRVSIHNISGWPPELLFASPNLRDVRLVATSITGLSETDGVALPLQCQLSSLSCDFPSLRSGVNQFLTPFYDTPTADTLVSKLEELHVDFGSQQGSGSVLLSQAQCLRTLCMAVEVNCTAAVACPLDILHPESFFTLRHLEVRVLVHLERPNIMVHHPYGCDWRKVLNQMTHLQRLKIHVIFQGHLDVHPASFGRQWGQIVDGTTPSGIDLRRQIEVTIQAKTVAREVPGEVRGKDALCFIDNIRLHVYPSQFLWLQGAPGDTPVSFSFNSEAVIQNAECRCWRHRGINVT